MKGACIVRLKTRHKVVPEELLQIGFYYREREVDVKCR